MTRLCLIIPTKNHAEYVRQLLGQLAGLALSGVDVVWADNASNDETREVIAASGIGRLVECAEGAGLGATLNGAARTASSDAFVFLRPDVILPQTDWLGSMRRVFEANAADIINVRMVYVDGTTFFRTGIAFDGRGNFDYLQPWWPVPDHPYLIKASEVCFGVRAETWHAVGGFDEELAQNLVHVDFAIRLGNPARTVEADELFAFYNVDNYAKLDAWETDRAVFSERHSVLLDFEHRSEKLEAQVALAARHNDVATMTEITRRYEELLAAGANYAKIHNNLGAVYFGLGDIAKATQHLEQAIAIDPSLDEARENLAHVRGSRLQSSEDRPENLQAEDHPKVSIVIPVHNGLAFTTNCIKSIFDSADHPTYEVIIVDNASTDGTGEYLRRLEKHHVKTVFNSENKGFVEACNLGADAASGDYVLLLNNDTEVQPGWLSSLVDLAERTPDCGAVGSKLVYPDGRLQEAGGIIFSDGSGWNYGKGQSPSDPRFNFVREVDYCSGAALLVRKSLWDDIGGLDHRYAPAYCEDSDLCFEIRKRGYRVYYQPKSMVVHHEGKTAGTDLLAGFKRYQVENQKKFREKWATELAGQYANLHTNVIRASNRRARKSVLVADAFLPCFDQSSGGLKFFNFVKLLRELDYHVTFIGRNPSLESRYRPILEDLGIEVYAGDVAAMKAAGMGLTEVAPIPYERLFRERQFDCAILAFWHVAEYYVPLLRRLSPQTRTIVDTGDFHYLREMREAELKNDAELLRKAMNTKRWEIAVYRQADKLWTVTPQDKEAIEQYVTDTPIDVVPNVHDQVCADKSFEDSSGLLFVGNFNHPPNTDAMVSFCKEVLPLIRRDLPDVKLHIVGPRPPLEVREFASDRVIVTDYVEDLSPYLMQARISVNPLRYGAGMKGKIGEALSWGLPVVTTTVGAEGMELVDGKDALIADTAEEFAARVVKLYKDKELWNMLSKNGRAKVDKWSPAAVKDLIEASLTAAESARRQPLTSIVIVALNQLAYTKKCVDSVLRNTNRPYELVLVDNGSADGTAEYFEEFRLKCESAQTEYCKAVKTIRHDRNLGFAAGNNSGIAAASGDYVLLLNNDVVVTPGWLEKLARQAEWNPRVGLVGPVSNLVAGPQYVPSVSYDTTTLKGLEEFAKRWSQEHDGVGIALWRVVGFCALITRGVIDEIGGLDTRYGLGNYEDDDFCIRATIAGFRRVIAKDCFVHHFGSRTFAGERIDRDRLLASNWEIFKQKWGLPADLASGAYKDLVEVMRRPFDPNAHYCPVTAGIGDGGGASDRWFAAPCWDEAASWEPVVEDYLRSHSPGDGAALQVYAGRLTDSDPDDACRRVEGLILRLGLSSENVPDIEITDELPDHNTTRVILTGGPLDESLRRQFPAEPASAGRPAIAA